ncbi:MAG: GH39 family glycosyl hydrolase [Phycisphaerae bacterium]
MDLKVHADQAKCDFEHFWQSTGFTPAKLLLQDDMKQTLRYIGSVPHRGIVHCRMHYLMDLIGGENFDTENPTYLWNRLDKGIDLLVECGMKPFFEVMGNPAGWFSDFYDDTQLHAFKRVVRDMALHLMDRYGREEVESWYFETWNEPDAGWWPQWPAERKSFHNYYDACSEGLKEANPKLVFGGPGACRHITPWLKDFFAHLDTGRNYFTGEEGVRCDFISMHEKGLHPCVEDIDPDTLDLTEREVKVLNYLRENHPRLAEIPMMNNECDPHVAWGHTHTWRGKSYYASQVVYSIDLHMKMLMDQEGIEYLLLGNDNGFLGEWGYRTQLTKFTQKVKKGQKPSTSEFALVKKPVLTVMELLTLLGDERLEQEINGQSETPLGMIATRRGSDQVAIVLYNHTDRIMAGGKEHVNLTIDGLGEGPWTQVHYRIDYDHNNPFEVWAKATDPGDPGAGTPLCPSNKALEKIRAVQEPTMEAEPAEIAVSDGTASLDFDLQVHSVSLVLLTKKPSDAPAAPSRLRSEKYPGLHPEDAEELLLMWDGVDSRNIRTYEILFSESVDGEFSRINGPDQIANCFMHTRPVRTKGYYKVRAVDYWDRAGEESDVLEA